LGPKKVPLGSVLGRKKGYTAVYFTTVSGFVTGPGGSSGQYEKALFLECGVITTVCGVFWGEQYRGGGVLRQGKDKTGVSSTLPKYMPFPVLTGHCGNHYNGGGLGGTGFDE